MKNTILENTNNAPMENVSRETMASFTIDDIVTKYNNGKEYKTIKDFSPDEIALLTMDFKAVPDDKINDYTALKSIYGHIDRLARNLSESAYISFLKDANAFYTVSTNGHTFRRADITDKAINVSRETLVDDSLIEIVVSGKCESVYYNGTSRNNKVCELWLRKDGYRVYSKNALNEDSIVNETKSSKAFSHITRIVESDRKNAIHYLIAKHMEASK